MLRRYENSNVSIVRGCFGQRRMRIRVTTGQSRCKTDGSQGNMGVSYALRLRWILSETVCRLLRLHSCKALLAVDGVGVHSHESIEHHQGSQSVGRPNRISKALLSRSAAHGCLRKLFGDRALLEKSTRYTRLNRWKYVTTRLYSLLPRISSARLEAWPLQ